MGFSTGAPEHLSQAQLEQLKNTIIKYLPHQVRFTAKHNWTTSSGSSGWREAKQIYRRRFPLLKKDIWTMRSTMYCIIQPEKSWWCWTTLGGNEWTLGIWRRQQCVLAHGGWQIWKSYKLNLYRWIKSRWIGEIERFDIETLRTWWLSRKSWSIKGTSQC